MNQCLLPAAKFFQVQSHQVAWQGKYLVEGGFAKLKEIGAIFWSGRPDLNSGPPAPKARAETLSSWFV
jgi:hypothetical protein